MLQCMTDPDDVYEYVDNKTVKKIHIRRLLEWVASASAGRASRTVTDVRSSIRFIFRTCCHIWDKHVCLPNTVLIYTFLALT